METATIPAATIGEKTDRSSSPTPSDCSSIYYELNKEGEICASTEDTGNDALRSSSPVAHENTFENEPKPSGSTAPSTPISEDFYQNALPTPPATPETSSHKTFLDQAEKPPAFKITRDAEEASAITRPNSPPSTPPTRPLPFNTSIQTLEISPSTSSNQSIDSASTYANHESPHTQRSLSASLSPFDSEPKTSPNPNPPVDQQPCLQCHLAGLRCSLASPPKRRRNTRKLCCTRCVRNGEEFCILQVEISDSNQQAQVESHERNRGHVQESQHIYFALDTPREVVSARAEAMLEGERVKRRWELPQPSLWKLEKMKPGFGWFVDGSREELRRARERRFEGWGC